MLSAVVQGIGVLEVDLVLSRRDLVMGGLDLEAHVLENLDDLRAGTPRPCPWGSCRSSRRHVVGLQRRVAARSSMWNRKNSASGPTIMV